MPDQKDKIINLIMKGDLEALKNAVEKDPTLLDYISPSGDTPAHFAALNGKLEMLQYLCEKKPKFLKKKGSKNRKLAHIAAIQLDMPMLDYLYDANKNLFKSFDSQQFDPLLYVAKADDQKAAFDILKHFYEKDPALLLNKSPRGKDTVMRTLAESYDMKAVKYFYEKDPRFFIFENLPEGTSLSADPKIQEMLDRVQRLGDAYNDNYEKKNQGYLRRLISLKLPENLNDESDLLVFKSFLGMKDKKFEELLTRDNVADIIGTAAKHYNVLEESERDKFLKSIQRGDVLSEESEFSARVSKYRADMNSFIEREKEQIERQKELDEAIRVFLIIRGNWGGSGTVEDLKREVDKDSSVLDLKFGMFGTNLAQYAIRHKQMEIFEYLATVKPELLDEKDSIGFNVVHVAAVYRNPKAIERLGEMRPDLFHVRDKNGDLPEDNARDKDMAARIKQIREANPLPPTEEKTQDPSEKEPDALFKAFESGTLDDVKAIMNVDRSLLDNYTSYQDFNLAVLVIESGDMDKYNYLLSEKPQVLDALSTDKWNLAHLAAKFDQVDIMMDLESRKPTLLDVKNSDGQLPSDIAASDGPSVDAYFKVSGGTRKIRNLNQQLDDVERKIDQVENKLNNTEQGFSGTADDKKAGGNASGDPKQQNTTSPKQQDTKPPVQPIKQQNTTPPVQPPKQQSSSGSGTSSATGLKAHVDAIEAAVKAFGGSLDVSGKTPVLSQDADQGKIDDLIRAVNKAIIAKEKYYKANGIFDASNKLLVKYDDVKKNHADAHSLEMTIFAITRDGKSGNQGWLQDYMDTKAAGTNKKKELHDVRESMFEKNGLSLDKGNGVERGGMLRAQSRLLERSS